MKCPFPSFLNHLSCNNDPAALVPRAIKMTRSDPEETSVETPVSLRPSLRGTTYQRYFIIVDVEVALNTMQEHNTRP